MLQSGCVSPLCEDRRTIASYLYNVPLSLPPSFFVNKTVTLFIRLNPKER